MVYPRGERDVESHLRKTEEREKRRKENRREDVSRNRKKGVFQMPFWLLLSSESLSSAVNVICLRLQFRESGTWRGKEKRRKANKELGDTR